MKIECGWLHMGINTIYDGIHELLDNHTLPSPKDVRRKGGGRKSTLSQHPEYIDVFREVVKDFIAGLPQDEDVTWLYMTPAEIAEQMSYICKTKISEYIVKQIIEKEGYHTRTSRKDLPLAESENRDEQFKIIAGYKDEFISSNRPVLSMDTKKKELLGNFKRDNSPVYTQEVIKTYDHDYPSFSNGKMVPHGIYDVGRNTGYMTFGLSHDTAEFACACLLRHWKQPLQYIYPTAKEILILCDGGGSNSCRGWLFKYMLIKVAKELKIDIRVAHFPPYHSKWNPIEHRLFSQITRVWKGFILSCVKLAAALAAKAKTETGLAVFTAIDESEYETGMQKPDNYQDLYDQHVVHDETLPKWNYVIKWNPKS